MLTMSDETTSSAKPSTSPEKSSDKTASSPPSESSSGSGPGGDAGRSSRESVGGATAVHYGYFSNIKTPEYRSGWDDIWGKKKPRGDNGAAAQARPKSKPTRTVRPKEPVILSLSFDDLPEEARLTLVETARAKLRKSRLNYDRRDEAGAVSWRIECEVRR